MAQHPTPLRIANRLIGPGEPCYIIAEIGLNHNGDLSVAKQLIDEAVIAKVDAVKFQKRNLGALYQQELLEQPRRGEQGLQYIVPLLAEFELSDSDFKDLRDYAAARGMTFLCTPWDISSVALLEELDLPAFKIGSPDLVNLPLIERVLATGKPILLSTGMSSEDEIRRTLAFLDEREAQYGVFHCVSTYPAAADEINLRFMQVLREWSGRPVGYSGHDTGTAISLAAVAMGAAMLERHLTLDRGMRGPDHSSSLDPATFAAQVRAVREVEAALGTSKRWMTRGEILNRRTLGKSLCAAADIEVGTVITREMIAAKSPGMGLSPQELDRLIGRVARRHVGRDQMLVEDDFLEATSGVRPQPIDVGTSWGIVARFTDVDGLVARFADAGMSFVEFHVSDKDLDAGFDCLGGRTYPYGLVVHAPEYCYDTLIDLCAADAAQRRLSIERIQKTIELTRALLPSFAPMWERGPKIVIHVGGMSPNPDGYDLSEAIQRLLDSLARLDTRGVDLLLENLPPFPWYFGGKWFGHIAVDADMTERLCRESGLGLCFDASHAALECNRSGSSLLDFANRVAPFVRHLHVADAAGTSGEGLAIGEGEINFVALLPALLRHSPTLVPEIWMGHHQDGKGFRLALERLTDAMWAGQALSRLHPADADADLESLKVPLDASIMFALQRIDGNRMGIGFVVDAHDRMEGVITDGDIRHGLVKGMGLHSRVCEIMTRNFVFGRVGMTADELRARLPGRSRVIPVLNDNDLLVDFAHDRRLPVQCEKAASESD